MTNMSPSSLSAAQQQRLDHLESHARKRVGKACDRCRLKKAGCTEGDGPCKRCVQDNETCTYTERQPNKEKTYTNSQAQYLEQTNEQMKAGLIKMFQILDNSNLWTGTNVSRSSDGSPMIHDILEGLGVIGNAMSRRTSSHSLSEEYEQLADRPHKRARSDSYQGRRSIDSSVPALAHVETPETTPTMTVPVVANSGMFTAFSPSQRAAMPSKTRGLSSLEVPIFNPEAALAYSEPLMIDLSSDFSPMVSQNSSPADLMMYGGGPSPYMFNETTTASFFDSALQAPTNPFFEPGSYSEFGLESLSRTISSN